MNAVLGISRLLADTSLSLEQQQLLQMITNSGHLLLTIINDILDLSVTREHIACTHFPYRSLCVCVSVLHLLTQSSRVVWLLLLLWVPLCRLFSSKIEAGQLKLERGVFRLIDVVETATILCHDAAATKGLDLHYWMQPDAPLAFMVDATRLQQVRASFSFCSFFLFLSTVAGGVASACSDSHSVSSLCCLRIIRWFFRSFLTYFRMQSRYGHIEAHQ